MSRKKNKPAGVFLLIVLPLVAVGISSYAIYRGVRSYITTSSYFRIREIKAQGITDKRYLDMMRDEILGTNIFRLDAGNLAARIKRKFPTFHSVTVHRVLPSQLLIVATERMPVALFKKDLYYLFDVDGVVLSASAQPLDLPVIVGLEDRLQTIKVGTAYQLNMLRRPLLLAKALRPYTKEEKIKVTRIDATDPDSLSFYLEQGIQVKIGDREFDSRIGLLPAILRSVGHEMSQIKYIDLRPKQPVIAAKDNRNRP